MPDNSIAPAAFPPPSCRQAALQERQITSPKRRYSASKKV